MKLGSNPIRWYVGALILALTSFGGLFWGLEHQASRLQEFCARIPTAQPISALRQKVEEQGFQMQALGHKQYRIDSPLPDLRSRHCRVFFNVEQTVQFRSWQQGELPSSPAP